MHPIRAAVLVLVLGALAAAWHHGVAPAIAQTPATPAQGARPASAAAPDSFAAQRDSMMNAVLRDIAGKESVAAESVFKNIKVMKGVPAGRLVRAMNMGFGRGLGVGCLHCHTREGWDDEGRKEKQVTRDMMAMTRRINDSLLTAIPNLDSEKPTINCTTCHRGQVKPALNLGP